MTGADGNQMDTESFLASLHVLTTNDIKDRDGNTIVAAGKEVPFRLVTQQYGKGIVSGSKSLTDATGVCYLDITHPVGNAGVASYDGYIGASATTASAFTSQLLALTMQH
jgi:hypothetical protein